MDKSFMIDRVRDWLEADDWKYEFEADRELIRSGVNLKCKLGNVRMAVSFNEKGFTSYAYPSLKASESERDAVMKYVTLANYNLRNGNFEMDLSDGEVRYKVYTNTRDMDDISDAVIADAITIPFLMFERYGDGLAALMMGFSDPETEIAKAEGK